VSGVCVTVKNEEFKINFIVKKLRKNVTDTYHAVRRRIGQWLTSEKKKSFN